MELILGLIAAAIYLAVILLPWGNMGRQVEDTTTPEEKAIREEERRAWAAWPNGDGWKRKPKSKIGALWRMERNLWQDHGIEIEQNEDGTHTAWATGEGPWGPSVNPDHWKQYETPRAVETNEDRA